QEEGQRQGAHRDERVQPRDVALRLEARPQGHLAQAGSGDRDVRGRQVQEEEGTLMTASPQHPFTVELQDGTVIGGARAASDAVTLAAGAVPVFRGTLLVKDSSSGSVVAQIGRVRETQEPPAIGPQLQTINPASADPGLAPQVLTCSGSGFQDGADILWDG